MDIYNCELYHKLYGMLSKNKAHHFRNCLVG